MPGKQNRRMSPREYPADKARQGDIILRRRWQRWLFIAALVVLIVVAVTLRLLAFR
jgi:hypothetical protein